MGAPPAHAMGAPPLTSHGTQNRNALAPHATPQALVPHGTPPPRVPWNPAQTDLSRAIQLRALSLGPDTPVAGSAEEQRRFLAATIWCAGCASRVPPAASMPGGVVWLSFRGGPATCARPGHVRNSMLGFTNCHVDFDALYHRVHVHFQVG